jgi:hypothetical protein
MNLQIADLVETTVQMNSSDFDKFLQEVYQKRAKQKTSALSLAETDLLNKIYQKIPQGVLKRFNFLKEKLSAEIISTEEHSEFMGLIEIIEGHDADCLMNIVHLAKLRGVHPKILMQQLDVFQPKSV